MMLEENDKWFSTYTKEEKTLLEYDALEIHPVKKYHNESDGMDYFEQCDSEEADLFSVYGHIAENTSGEGGLECIEDFKTLDEAMVYAIDLREKFPNLCKHVLWVDD